MLFYKCGVILTAFLKLKSWVATTPRLYRKIHRSTNGSFCIGYKQVRLAMVPRDSQQRPQLYEQLTWNSDEQLLK